MGTVSLRVNPAVTGMARSGIREVMDAAWGRHDVIRLEVGEPDFPTPPHIIEAAHVAALEGHTGYMPSAGLPQLREALAVKVRERNGYSVTPEQTIVTQGGVEAIYASLLTLTQPGDEILLPDPAWPNFLMMARLLNLTAVTYPLTLESGFQPTVETLGELVSDRTSVIVVNSPSNPLGAVIGAGRMTQLLEFAERHGLWVVSDECYDEISFDGTFVSPASISSERVVSVYSFSKTYAMTGWRLGYGIMPSSLAEEVAKLTVNSVSCTAGFTQYAGIAALQGSQQPVDDMVAEFRARRSLVVEGLNAIPGITCRWPKGAFYAFPNVTGLGLSSSALADRLLLDHGVATLSGSSFGAGGEGYLRLSYANSRENLQESLRRIAAAAAEFSG